MDGELKNLTIFCSSVTSSLCYCYLLPSAVPKGKFRLLTLLPILSLFTFLPLLLLSYAFTTAIATFFITWLTNFKLLLFAFDLGPLSSSPKPKSLLLFVTTAALPIKIKSTDHEFPGTPNKLPPLILAAEILIFALLMTVMHDYKDRVHAKLVLVMYCCLMYLLIDVMVSVSTIVLNALVVGGGELERPSDEPYLSNSLQEFWGRRWNLMATNALRCTVYEPVRSTSATLLGNRRWATAAGVMASFIISGLMHELLFYYATRAPPTWEMTSFFVLHGACVVVETALKREVKGKLRLPWYVTRPLTVAFVAVTGFWLFFPPLTRCGADEKALAEFQLFLEFVKSELMKLYSFMGQN